MALVIIPTFNERENVEAIVRAVFAQNGPFHVLIVDDGSPDGTAQIVRDLMKTEFADRLFLLERAGKLGLGTAYIAGFRWGLARKYDYGRDPLTYAENQMALVNLYRERLIEKFVKDGESWAKAREGFELTLGQQMKAVSMIANCVSGSQGSIFNC